MEDILGVTYGKPIYQEQLMQIFNRFAGFSLGESDIIRRLMSKKKVKEFVKYKGKFIDGLQASGAKKKDAEAFWEQIVKFSEYGFNKSHACAYAITAYYTAYLKYHYPKEYFAAVLNDTDFEKIGDVIADAKSFGIKVLPPDINESEYRFSALDSENSIRYGLSNIKNVASSATEIIEKRDTPYASFADFSERTQVSIDSVKNLILAGCFDRLYRKELLVCRNDLLFEIGETPFDKKMSCLVAEKNVLSAFLSVNPMDGFMSKHRVADVKLVDGAIYTVSGVITSTATKRTKVKRAEFTMFDLDDGDGVLTLAFFPSPYKTDFSPCIKPNERVQIQLKCAKSKDGTLRLNVEDIRLFGHGVKSIVLHLQDEKYGDYQDIINGYKDNGGVPLFVKVGNGTPYKNGIHVKPAILDDSRINKSLTAET